MLSLMTDPIDRLREASAQQGDLSSLDKQTAGDSAELGRQTAGASGPGNAKNWPFIWGTIRILAIYGTWSWWKRKGAK